MVGLIIPRWNMVLFYNSSANNRKRVILLHSIDLAILIVSVQFYTVRPNNRILHKFNASVSVTSLKF